MLRLQQQLIMEDNQTESYDQSRLQALKKQVQVSKTEMIKLAYSDQNLLNKLDELNMKGAQSINDQSFYEAIVYLTEAENILQYAAGCGRTIDRVLIISTLHNLACVYQRIWQLNKSADYIEAIIFNITNFLSNQHLNFNFEIGNKNSAQYHRLITYFSNKLQLISYNLQFCAVSSQIKNHQNALNSAQQALSLLKCYCQQVYAFERLMGNNVSNDLQKNLLCDLHNIRNFQNQSMSQTQKYIEKLLYKAKKSIIGFQKKLDSPQPGVTSSQLKQLEMFSLGQLMQVSPVLVRKMQEKLDLSLEITMTKKIYKAIYISIAHFTMATELRLIANEKHGVESNFRKLSKEFKQSEVHHLVAIITVSLYVPCYTKYFQHILNSFKNHYQIDLNQASDISISEDDDGDNLIHLEIQSISQRDSEMNGANKYENVHNMSKMSRGEVSKNGLSFQMEKSGHKTAQDINPISSQSSENQHLKRMNRTNAKEPQKKELKKQKKKLTEQTSREKINDLQKITSKSKSKGKKPENQPSKRSKSKKNHQQQSKQKIVHYFQYDNISKKVVKKKIKLKQPGQYELSKRLSKPIRDKKSPQAIITHHLKKINHVTLSSKELINGQNCVKTIKKGKSPQLNSHRSQKLGLKRIN